MTGVLLSPCSRTFHFPIHQRTVYLPHKTSLSILILTKPKQKLKVYHDACYIGI